MGILYIMNCLCWLFYKEFLGIAMAGNNDIENILTRAHGLAVYLLVCSYATLDISMVLLVDYTECI